jgi:hypothetical protein
MNTYHEHDSRLNGATLAPPRPVLDRRDRHCPPHTWDCPVLMKLDPLAVAWTCGSCGAIVTTPVGAPRPHGSGLPEG